MANDSFKRLDVWQRSVELVVSVYKDIEKLPAEEKYALSDQIRRSAVSVPSSIAEGQKRFTRKDTLHLTTIALGSLAELETQLIIAKKVYKLEVDNTLAECEIISRMLHALINSLRKSKAEQR